jgi:hypothetical protein
MLDNAKIEHNIRSGRWLDPDTLAMLTPDVEDAAQELEQQPLLKFEIDPMDLWRLLNEVRDRRAADAP